MKTVYFNGKLIPAEEARVSVFDRGFLYGDGLFETVKVSNSKPFRWAQHWDRFAQGCRLLDLAPPVDSNAAYEGALELLEREGLTHVLLRIHLSRGMGRRGYSTKGATSPNFIMSLHEAPESELQRWRVKTSAFSVLKADPVTRIKSSNKLLQILARQEAEQGGFDEALILNSEGEIAEGTSGNFFWIEDGTVLTPPLQAGILPGITRATVLEICDQVGIPSAERPGRIRDLEQAAAAFLTLSSFGLIEVSAVDDINFAGSPIIERLLQSYRELVALETR